MLTSDIYQIPNNGTLSTVTPVLFTGSSINPVAYVTSSGSKTAVPVPDVTSPIGGFPLEPLQSFNMATDYEGNLAYMPAYDGGIGSDINTGTVSDSGGNFGNAGASQTFASVTADAYAAQIPDYMGAGNALNNGDPFAVAQSYGMDELGQLSGSINWSTFLGDAGKGMFELADSSGASAFRAAAGAALAGLSKAHIQGGTALADALKIGQGLMVGIGGIYALIKTIQASVTPMTLNENAALQSMYHSFLAIGVANPGNNGGNAIGPANKNNAIGLTSGSVASVDTTIGGKMNFLTDVYNSNTGQVLHVHG